MQEQISFHENRNAQRDRYAWILNYISFFLSSFLSLLLFSLKEVLLHLHTHTHTHSLSLSLFLLVFLNELHFYFHSC